MNSQNPAIPAVPAMFPNGEAGFCSSTNLADTDVQDRADMTRLAAGHGPALNDLMARHAEKLFHYLVRSLQSEDDAADLAQETFVRVYQNRAKFDANKKFSTWLYTIASTT